jgi:hypothetical protein
MATIGKITAGPYNYSMTSKGSCEPKDSSTLLAFTAVQQQANRFLDAADKKLLTCDGIIGAKTLAAVNSIRAMFPVTGVLGADASSCRVIANSASSYASAMDNIANSRNLSAPECPQSLVRKILSPMPKVNTDGTVDYPYSAGGFPWWVLLAALGGGYYYTQHTKSGQKQWKKLVGGKKQ